MQNAEESSIIHNITTKNIIVWQISSGFPLCHLGISDSAGPLGVCGGVWHQADPLGAVGYRVRYLWIGLVSLAHPIVDVFGLFAHWVLCEWRAVVH